MNAEPVPEKILALEQPHPALWTYYIICSIFTGPAIFVMLPYLYFRYHTLRYRFDAEGIHMRVGILFRREVNLTYARIQDIHLRSGFIQRWLGLANLQVQTASGSTGPEMLIEGFKEFEAIRDFLYTRMRGYHAGAVQAPEAAAPPAGVSAPDAASREQAEMLLLLSDIRDELRRTRELIESRKAGPSSPQKSAHV
jgi:putative membrane protein